MKCSICLHGCDDDTTFSVELTESEKLLLERIASMSKATSRYACMPTMSVELLVNANEAVIAPGCEANKTTEQG